mmetsp:Transcript_78620/g.206948  ORF Transcript_78620/g.206948 Transcript_78620/m.206948 type:complete len:544 (-) Transcript_78620:201-1832(-)
MENLPLMAFLCNIITPEEYTRPSALMHWINCITFDTTSRQERSGEIPQDGWKDPQTFLFTRKGPVQDHALLLCSVLLGAKKDAFICKGTVWVHDEEAENEGRTKKLARLVEHVWVLTREQGDWVTFWEPSTRELYHLKDRWKKLANKKKHKKVATDGEEDGQEGSGEEEDGAAVVIHEEWDNEIPDMALGTDDIESLPTVGRMPKPKTRVAPKKANPRDKMKQDMLRQREKNKMAPRTQNPNLLQEGETLVDWLPYDSIDVVFNSENLWSNRQNHHPACITFNFDEEPEEEGGERLWDPLIQHLKTEEDKKTYHWMPINMEVVIDPALKFDSIERRQQEMVAEMEENMRLSRGKRGMDTYFDKSEKLLSQLDAFLRILEQMRKLDIDMCPWFNEAGYSYENWKPGERYLMKLRCGSEKKEDVLNQRYNKLGCAFGSSTRYADYIKESEDMWRKLAQQAENYANSGGFEGALLRGKTLTGFPAHFCTSDKEEVRSHLMGMSEYQRMMENLAEGTVFTIHCRMFAMLGGVQSLWIYIAMQEPHNS